MKLNCKCIIAAALVLAGCTNPIMEKLMSGARADKIDIQDFGRDPVIKQRITVKHTGNDENLEDLLRSYFEDMIPGNYVVILEDDIEITGSSIQIPPDVVVSLRGKKALFRTIPAADSLFRIGTDQKLILRDVTLKAVVPELDKEEFDDVSPGDLSLVRVEGGIFEMRSGKITGNHIENSFGSGVYVVSGGNFTMYGGSISENIIDGSGYGGGVYVEGGGSFTMRGGSVYGNAVKSGGFGGGVYVSGGIFTMYDGSIYENYADNGGGVYVAGGIFTMYGGTINHNTIFYCGGGVHISSGSGLVTFIKTGGTIADNFFRNTDISQDNNKNNISLDTAPHFNGGAGPKVKLYASSDGTEWTLFDTDKKIANNWD